MMIFRKPSTDVEGFRLENLMNEALQRRELLYYLASGPKVKYRKFLETNQEQENGTV